MPIKNANVNEAYLLSSISFSHLNRRSRRLMIINQILKIKLSHGSSKRGGGSETKIGLPNFGLWLEGRAKSKRGRTPASFTFVFGSFLAIQIFQQMHVKITHLVILCGDSNY